MGNCSLTGECSSSRGVAAPASIIRMVGEDVGRRWAVNSDCLPIENRDRVTGNRLQAVTVKCDIIDEVDRAIASAGVEPDQVVGRNRAATDIERSIRAKRTDFDRARIQSRVVKIDYTAAPLVTNINRAFVCLNRSTIYIHIAASGFKRNHAAVVG